MDFTILLPLLSMFDMAAAAGLLTGWILIGLLIEAPSQTRPSVNRLMRQHRREWMINHITRDPRVTDAMLLGSLREGTAFFASACLIAIGGALALIGDTDRLNRVAEELMLESGPALLWEIKILLPLLLITNAFMKFVWSHRVFGYCSVMMGAVPNDPDHPDAQDRAEKAAELNCEAARSFNRGLRSVYFALGSLGWLIGPEALVVTTVATVVTILYREFASSTRRVLLANRTATASAGD